MSVAKQDKLKQEFAKLYDTGKSRIIKKYNLSAYDIHTIEDLLKGKYHMFRCSNARLKESMKVLTKAYSELWEYLEQEHGDVLDEFLMREE